MSEAWFIAADVGGTNIRLGAFHDDRLVETETHSTKAGTSVVDAIGAFSRTLPEPPKVVVVAAAGPVSDNRVQLTNADQMICGEALAKASGAPIARVINDFVAAAWATHTPLTTDLRVLKGAASPPTGTRLVVGPGTGLGVGALAYDGDKYVSLPGEGGHVGIAPYDAADTEVFKAFRDIWPEVFFDDTLALEAEGMLSGTGLPLLYQAVSAAEGSNAAPLTAVEIMAAAQSAQDPIAVRTTQIFQRYLGQVAGDLALAFGADGGVFLVGGVAMKNTWLFDDKFVAAFNTGGRFTARREALNLYLLELENFGLQGAHSFARQIHQTS